MYYFMDSVSIVISSPSRQVSCKSYSVSPITVNLKTAADRRADTVSARYCFYQGRSCQRTFPNRCKLVFRLADVFIPILITGDNVEY